MARPTRIRKHDRQTYGGAPANEVRIDMMLAPFDRAVTEADKRWGVDVLPELVSQASAGKWGYAVGRLNEAIAAADQDAVAQWVASCIRGLGILEAEAQAAGHQPIPPTAWTMQMEDGTRYAVVQDVRQWTAAKANLPDGTIIVSLREALMALHHHKTTASHLPTIRDAFPTAEVVSIRSKLAEELEDEIPF